MLPKLFVESKLWKTPDSKRKKHPVLNIYNPRKVFSDHAKCEARLDALDSATTLDQYFDLCAADEGAQQQPPQEKLIDQNLTEMNLTENIVPSKSWIKSKTVKKSISFKFVQTNKYEESLKPQIEATKKLLDKKLSAVMHFSRCLQTEWFEIPQMPDLKGFEKDVFDKNMSSVEQSSSPPIIDTYGGIESNLSSLLSSKCIRKTGIIHSKTSDLDFETCLENTPSKISSEILPFESFSLSESNNCICKESRSSILNIGNDSESHININCTSLCKCSNCICIESRSSILNTGNDSESHVNINRPFDRTSLNIKDVLPHTDEVIYHTNENSVTEVLSRNHKTVIEEIEKIRSKVNKLNSTISNVEKLISNVEEKVPNPTLCITNQPDSFLLGLQQKILDDFHKQVQGNRLATEGALKVLEHFEEVFCEVNPKTCLLQTETTPCKTGCIQLKYVEKLEEEKEQKKKVFINECKQGIIFKEIKQLEEIQNHLFKIQDYIEQISFN